MVLKFKSVKPTSDTKYTANVITATLERYQTLLY